LFGHWHRANANSSEEVIVCRKDETSCEVHCHGGRAAAAAIVADIVARGATEIDWRDWIRRGTADVLQAEALSALADAPTERCAHVLLDQYYGALRRALEELQSFVKRQKLDQATRIVSELLRRARYGLQLTRPFRVALLGPPNVGKSSLINRLLGYERSIVFDQPGTTRDAVSAVTAFDGWPVELIDTAGLRETTDPIDVAGTRSARKTADDADLVLLIAESVNVISLPSIDPSKNVLRVVNKIDQCPLAFQTSQGWLPTCALSGAGIPLLVKAIVDRLVPDPPRDGDAVPFTERQQQLLADINVSLDRQSWNSIATSLARLTGS
jgi:tRNA modification GTPase